MAAFLGEKGLAFSETLPAEGFAETLPVSEMDALAKELGAAEDSEQYDNTALMLVLLTGRAPVYEEDAPEAEGETEEAASEGDAAPSEVADAQE